MASLGHRGSLPFQSIPKLPSLGGKDQEGFLSEPRACLDSVWQYCESRCQASVGELGFWPSLKLEKTVLLHLICSLGVQEVTSQSAFWLQEAAI